MQLSLFGDSVVPEQESPGFVALDLETTGLKPPEDHIIEVGAVRFAGDEVLGMTAEDCGLQALIKPPVVLNAEITRITGITQEMLADQPTWEKVRAEVQSFLDPPVKYLVAHNASFERSFLTAHGLDLDHLIWLDTIDMVAMFMPDAPGASLGVASHIMSVAPRVSHRAAHDALTTGQLFILLWQRMREMSDDAIQQIMAHAPANWRYRDLFQIIAKERKLFYLDTKSPISQAGVEPDRPLAYAPKIAEVSNQTERTEHQPTASWLVRLLQPGNSSVVSLPCDVASSKELARECADWATRNDTHLLLVLPHCHDFAHRHRMFQLLKDAARASTPGPQIVWQSNPRYMCDLPRLNSWKANRTLDQKEATFLTQILYWITSSSTGHWPPNWLYHRWYRSGSRSHLLWPLVAGSADSNSADLAPQREAVLTSSPVSARGRITVMDHDTLLSGLTTDPDFALNFDAIVVDDIWNLWYQIPLTCTQTCTLGTMTYLLQEMGSLPRSLSQETREQGSSPMAECDRLVASLTSQVETWTADLDRFKENLKVTAQGILEHESRARKRRVSLVARDLLQMDSSSQWDGVFQAWQNLRTKSQFLIEHLEALVRALSPGGQLDYGKQVQAWQREFDVVLQQMDLVLGNAQQPRSLEAVKWVTLRTEPEQIEFNFSQLWTEAYVQRYLGKVFQQVLFLFRGRQRSLPQGFLSLQLGLSASRHPPSPFSPKFRPDLKVVVPEGLADPKSGLHFQQVKELLPEILGQVQKSVLVLFARTFELRQVSADLRHSLAETDTLVLIQDWDPWDSIVEGLHHQGRRILFCTFDILQQVSLDHVELECVVVTRLPFPSPANPVQSRQMQMIQQQTGTDNEFRHFVLPQVGYTMLRLMDQLITPTSPQGVMFLLDPRIRENYLKSITQPWPEPKWHYPELTDMTKVVKRMFVSRQTQQD